MVSLPPWPVSAKQSAGLEDFVAKALPESGAVLMVFESGGLRNGY